MREDSLDQPADPQSRSSPNHPSNQPSSSTSDRLSDPRLGLPVNPVIGPTPLSDTTPNLGLGDPAEVLVELAKRGDIDPWDIDIARITEKFLTYIDSLERRDLRIPARTLLYASTLLRMKSDAMEWFREVEPEPEPEPLSEPDEDQDKVRELPAQPIRRKTKRPVTLEELISELKKAEVVGRRKAIREMLPQSPSEKRLDLSHEEGIEDRIKILEAIVDDVFVTKEVATFQEVNRDKDVLNYVSLLFMAQRKTVWLEQEVFFGELFIKRHPQNRPVIG